MPAYMARKTSGAALMRQLAHRRTRGTYTLVMCPASCEHGVKWSSYSWQRPHAAYSLTELHLRRV